VNNNIASRLLLALIPSEEEQYEIASFISESEESVMEEAMYYSDNSVRKALISKPYVPALEFRLCEGLSEIALNYNHSEDGAFGIKEHMECDRTFQKQGFKVIYNLLVANQIPGESWNEKHEDDPTLFLNIMVEDKDGTLYVIQQRDIQNITKSRLDHYTFTQVVITAEYKEDFIRELAIVSLKEAYESERLDGFLLLFEEFLRARIDLKKVFNETGAWLPRGLMTLINSVLDIDLAQPSIVMDVETSKIQWEVVPQEPDNVLITLHETTGDIKSFVLKGDTLINDKGGKQVQDIYSIKLALLLSIKIKEARLKSADTYGTITNSLHQKKSFVKSLKIT